MKRRQILVAGGLAVAGGFALAQSRQTSRGTDAGGVVSAAGALLPISVNARVVGAPIAELQVQRFLPAEAKTSLVRWDFDLELVDESSLVRTIYAWQLKRTRDGRTSSGSSLRLRFPQGARLAIASTIHGQSGQSQVYSATLPSSTYMVLVTPRASTGLPPALADLRFDAGKQRLSLADGSPRDFDALLLLTA